MNNFTMMEIVKEGWPVLSVLLICSIFSITIAVDRWFTYKKALIDPGKFIKSVIDIMASRGVTEAAAYCDSFRQPIASVAKAALLAEGPVADQEHIYRNEIRYRMKELQNYIPALGTVGSLAPYIGLFGTVMGIIKAFASISVNSAGGPEVVAGGMSEALATTAAGLLVAIPAVAGFNFFIVKMRKLADDIDLAAFEILRAKNRNKNNAI